MVLERIYGEFCVVKEKEMPSVPLGARFWFTAVTDTEYSLVCPCGFRPNEKKRWKMFRVKGQLDFSLIGILAGISSVLAEAGVGIFGVSTFDTDYMLTDTSDAAQAEHVLEQHGYTFEGTVML